MKGVLHTFGGRGMDRYLFEFEPEADAAEGGAGAPVAEVGGDAVPGAEPGAEATAPEAEVPSPAAAEPPSWAPDPDEWDSVRAGLSLLAQREAAREAADARGEEPTWNLDPIENDNFVGDLQSFLEHRDQRLLDGMMERLAPVLGTVQEVQVGKANEQVTALLDGITGINGWEPDATMFEGGPTFRDGARELAAAFVDQVKAELGLPLDQPGGARVAQEALKRSATMLASLRQAAMKAGEEAYVRGMKDLQDGPRTPAAEGVGVEGVAEPATEEEAVRRLLSRASA